MAKKIRMTFRAKERSVVGDYMFDKDLSIVDDDGNLGSMTDVAAYMMAHVEGFQGYSVEVVDDEEKEDE